MGSRYRSNHVAAASLVGHVAIVLLVMRCSELQRLELVPSYRDALHPRDPTRVELRQLPPVKPRVIPYERVICGGFPPPHPPRDTEVARPIAIASPPLIAIVPPSTLRSLFVAGDTQIHPSATVRDLMPRNGAERVDAVAKVCIDTTGKVELAKLLRTTRYAAFDEVLLSAIRRWRYRPYLRDGVPQGVCSTVTIVTHPDQEPR